MTIEQVDTSQATVVASGCEVCCIEVCRTLHPQSEGHVGVQWGHAGWGDVFWNGLRAPWACVEVLAGPGGHAIVYADLGKQKRCDCGSGHLELQRIEGDMFSVRRVSTGVSWR